MADKVFVIQLGSFSTKFGLLEDESPSVIESLYWIHEPSQASHPKDICSITDTKRELLSTLIISKLGVQLQEDLEDEDPEETNPSSQNTDKNEINLEISLLRDNNYKEPRLNDIYFGQEAIFHSQKFEKSPSQIFPSGNLPTLPNNTFNQFLLFKFFSKILSQKIPSSKFSETLVLITIPFNFSNLEILLLSKLFIEKLNVKGILFQYEFVCALYSLKLSSACFVDVGGNSIKTCCMRDGFEIYQTRCYLPYGGQIQNICIDSVLQSSDDVSGLTNHIAESIKTANTISSYNNISSEEVYVFKKEGIKVTLPKLRSLLSTCFLNEEALKIILDKEYLNFTKETFENWYKKSEEITELPAITDRNPPVQKLKDTLNKKFSKSAQKRKRYTVEQQYNEGRRFGQTMVGINTLDQTIANSILGTEDVREVRFYAQQIVLLGGGSKTKRIVLALEKSLNRILKSTVDDVKVQILKVKPEEEADILPWCGIKEIMKIENPLQYFLMKGKIIDESYIRNTGLIDFENMMKFNAYVI